MISDFKPTDEPDAIKRAADFGIDISLLIENLKRTPTERIENFLRWLAFAEEVRRSGKMKRINNVTRSDSVD